MDEWICERTGAARVVRREPVQSLWSGYGQIVRVFLEGAPFRSVVLKHVVPGGGDGLGHERKLRSYDVELEFYEAHAPRLANSARVARCLAAERMDHGWRFLLEDLDAAGFDGRRSMLSEEETASCLRWLARFHATYLHRDPQGLWSEGTYWHLATRPDELAAIADASLRDSARGLDDALSGARYRTLVHGDAKPANFCFASDGRVAAVDFQYVGGGCGMKDVAYLLFGRRGWGAGDGATEAQLDHYFAVLREALDPAADAADLEREWRELYPVARADFHRFLAGWSPSQRAVHDYRVALAALD